MADLHLLEEKQAPPEILVVDDDAMVLDIVVESIRAAGLNADACEDGAEALAKNEATHYDLILTDMKLPGLDGLSLIKRLKADNSDTDVIVITGYGSVENAVECMKAGAIDYIIKPFTVDQIQVAVRKALDHRELRRRALERELYRELSYLDPLTGIHNRRYFDEALEAETQKSLRHKAPLVLLMIDIDDFKQYQNNDHQRGDEALKKMAHLFKTTCRVYDVVTRFGGEEFAIIFPGAGLEHSMEMAGRILQEVRDASFEGEERCPLGTLTVSIGVACFPEHASSSAGLVRCADQALDEAKRRGKNNVQLWGSFR
ncbi:MAG: diguanylate cyclase [Desulfomonile tiedjei]|nr:diguanylate cyclase [Desulfomonile tiedjei]